MTSDSALEEADDLGTTVRLARPMRRVVSLVPSITETIASVDPALLVGATDWCVHPGDLDVVRVRGTKNPDTRLIADLAPDLVVANMEENRKVDVERLRDAGIPVWVTRIESVPEALDSLTRLLSVAMGCDIPSWLATACDLWAEPSPDLGIRVAVPVWRDPWFVVGPRTFAHDLLVRCGFQNAFGEADQRYPKVALTDITSSEVDLVLLPDEPYQFGPADGPGDFSTRTALIPGRSLTWYGPTLLTARTDLVNPALAAMRPPR